eukprot:TRINITY_DN1139_c1_g1_i1.p1 TRINITY_DN1139_c1_g1~~TRINITY_DN1139_c1_g1_i1.p1  ORF type:complete len:509 (+),score=79.31 TRINITY_DN1139_c1_g1_i1:154-1680(+)
MLDDGTNPEGGTGKPPRYMIPYIRVELRRGIGMKNYLTFLYASWLTITAVVFINASMPFLLTNFLKIPQDSQGTVTGNAILTHEVTIILTSSLWGMMSDKVGRRIIYVIGLVLVSLGIFMHSYITEVYILILVRILFALGSAASLGMLTALLADYPTNNGRGKSGGMMGLTAGLGALTALFLFLRIPLWLKLSDTTLAGRIMYWGVGCFLLLSSIVLWFGLNPVSKAKEYVSLVNILKDGVLAGKNPKVLLAYMAGFAARGDAIVLTSFLSLWINKYYVGLGHTKVEALAKAGAISGIAQTVSLVAAPLVGFMADRFNRTACQAVSAFVAAGSYFVLFNMSEPTGAVTYVMVCLVGLGEIAMIVSSQVLIATEAPKSVRGAVGGFFALLGSVSILVSSKVGGYLFDNWKETAPFGLVGLWNSLVFLFAVAHLLYTYFDGTFTWFAPHREYLEAKTHDPDNSSSDSDLVDDKYLIQGEAAPDDVLGENVSRITPSYNSHSDSLSVHGSD